MTKLVTSYMASEKQHMEKQKMEMKWKLERETEDGTGNRCGNMTYYRYFSPRMIRMLLVFVPKHPLPPVFDHLLR